MESYNLNANSYIQKPHDFTNFAEVINQMLKLNITPINSF
jgi:hypothetical protein